MNRRDYFVKACMNLNDATQDTQPSPRPMLANFFLDCLNANQNADPRSVLLDAMQEIRNAFRELKSEMDGIDSIGM